MKAHKHWSIGALITMIGTFYTGYKGSKSGHRYFACSTLICLRHCAVWLINLNLLVLRVYEILALSCKFANIRINKKAL